MKNPVSLLRQHAKMRKNRLKIEAAVNSDQPIILIYQMGKVASSSIYHSLQNYPGQCHPFHTHMLKEERILRTKEVDKPKALFHPDRRKQLAVDLREQVINPSVPAKIITLFRDPFSRSISTFFENSSEVRREWPNFDEAYPHLEKTFYEYLPRNLSTVWFEIEFNPALGLDIYDHPFDASKGYTTFNAPPYEVLVLSTTLPDNEKEKQVSKLTGISNFQLKRSNTTSSTPRSALYKAFKKSIRFPKETVDEVLQSRYCQHFFDEKAREELRERWQK